MKKILITLSDKQNEALEVLMAQDLATNRTAFFASLIGAEAQRRKEAGSKRKPGRPRNDEEADPFDYSDDLPKNIPHFGEMIGPREYADKEEARSSFLPKS